MSLKIIDVRLQGGKINSSDVTVGRGDTVVWQSADGDLVVEFPDQRCFELPPGQSPTFRSAKGQMTTPRAMVRRDAPGGPVNCHITLGGKQFPGTPGVNIQPPQ